MLAESCPSEGEVCERVALVKGGTVQKEPVVEGKQSIMIRVFEIQPIYDLQGEAGSEILGKPARTFLPLEAEKLGALENIACGWCYLWWCRRLPLRCIVSAVCLPQSRSCHRPSKRTLLPSLDGSMGVMKGRKG
jgi:hypothetical protein